MNTDQFPLQSKAVLAALVSVCLCLVVNVVGAADQATSGSDWQSVEQFMQIDGRVRIIAHRGFSGRAPENTVASILEAIKVHADMAEIDVTLTADDQVVCLHDEKVKRTTDGKGRISELTLAEAQSLDAGSWFSPAFSGERIPTLDAMLEAAKNHILLNIEIKPETVERGITAKVVDTVTAHGMQHQVIISSFSPEALAQVHAIEPKMYTASLYNRKIHRGIDPGEIVGEVNSSMLNINRHYFKREIQERCVELGIPVGAYTANSKGKMEKLLDKGVHAIFTNYPDILRDLLEEQTEAPAAPE